MQVEKLPRLRTKRHTGKDGAVSVYYLWDGRSRGLKEIWLGMNREQALQRYADCEKGIYPTKPVRPQKVRARMPGRRRSIVCDGWLDAPAWVRTMFFNAERRANAAKRPFTLTPEQMLALVAKANGQCQLSGLPFEALNEKSPFAPSLDRLECSRGYEDGNVRIVCHVANVAMNTWGIEPVLKLAAAVLRKRSQI